MTRRTIAAAAALTAALALTSCGAGDTDSGDSSKPEPSSSSTDGDGNPEDADTHTSDAKLAKQGVEDHETWGPGAYVVHYEITNSGNEAADYFVMIEFLDSDGDVLGTTGITADKLGAGKTNRGDTSPLPAEIDNGEMSDIETARVGEVERTPSS